MANWLDGLRAKVMGEGPGVHLGAFGKHPGWDDHIEPIGLDSEPLLAARDILYVRGIGGVIDAAMWEKKPEETLPQIAHVFCWNGETDTLIGRMWSSTDGKGRARYPMVAIAHLGIPFSYSLAIRTGQVLARVEAQCRQATTAEKVRVIFAAGGEELRASLAQPADELGPEPDRATCSHLAHAMWLDEGDTFARSLYALEGRTKVFSRASKSGSGKISLKMLETDIPGQEVRLPMEPNDALDGIAFWVKVIANFAPLAQPLLFVHPVDHAWVDLIIGVPAAKQLFCIRANEAALPLASAVPYELDPAFRQAAADLTAKLYDPAPGASRPPEPPSEVPPPLPPMTQAS